jgi:hypothetical protein
MLLRRRGWWSNCRAGRGLTHRTNRLRGTAGTFGSLDPPLVTPGNLHRSFEPAPRAFRCASFFESWATAIFLGSRSCSSTMRAAVSENRSIVTCFDCIGYESAERHARCRGVTEPTASIGPRSGWSLAPYCFKLAVSQAPSVTVVVAAACSARAASSAASPAVSSTGATAVRIAAPLALFQTVPWSMERPRLSSRRARFLLSRIHPG